MTGLQMKTLLVTAASALALAACGSAEVASPGEGNFGNGGNNGGNNGGGNTPAPGTPAADCPTGLANVGTIANGSLRVCQLPQQILGNLSLAVRAGTIYSISGRTEVGTDRGIDPASTTGTQGILTIEPGVKIFASSGGQWGGIVLAGRAPQANCQLTAPVTCTGQVEGTNAFYGGNTATDNSGRLRYVQIKYSGFEISTGNELQALTLAGVGSGTVLEYIQSYNSSDDGIEIFGGNANLKHIVINGADDDGLDTDTGWRGGAQFGIVTQRAPNSTSRSAGFEFSSAPSSTPYASRYLSQPKIANWTMVGRNAPTDAHTVMHFDTGTNPTLINIVATSTTGSVAGCFDIADADTQTSFDGGTTPSLRSIYMSCSVSYRPANVARSTAVFTNARNTNVTAAGTSTLTAPASGTTIANQNLAFINGANENAVTAIDPKTVYSFFDSVNYIGAVRNAQDTWWQGWTCGLTAGSPC
ncbi:hypothetical protein LTR94_011862 [Friedmanniomyces endolithicus]|nr:hypothetical protein LTR94_011862 [Friedmanniomyces endolithicus]